jgi:hypothetical protein
LDIIDALIASVVTNFNWTPHYCHERLYLDDMDVFGLIYWYNLIPEKNKKEKQ